MASLDEAAAKRPKLDESVRVQLKSVEGAELGPALEVPLASGPAELGSIVSKLKNDAGQTPIARARETPQEATRVPKTLSTLI